MLCPWEVLVTLAKLWRSPVFRMDIEPLDPVRARGLSAVWQQSPPGHGPGGSVVSGHRSQTSKGCGSPTARNRNRPVRRCIKSAAPDRAGFWRANGSRCPSTDNVPSAAGSPAPAVVWPRNVRARKGSNCALTASRKTGRTATPGVHLLCVSSPRSLILVKLHCIQGHKRLLGPAWEIWAYLPTWKLGGVCT